jgi:hypothetical protein
MVQHQLDRASERTALSRSLTIILVIVQNDQFKDQLLKHPASRCIRHIQLIWSNLALTREHHKILELSPKVAYLCHPLRLFICSPQARRLFHDNYSIINYVVVVQINNLGDQIINHFLPAFREHTRASIRSSVYFCQGSPRLVSIIILEGTPTNTRFSGHIVTMRIVYTVSSYLILRFDASHASKETARKDNMKRHQGSRKHMGNEGYLSLDH